MRRRSSAPATLRFAAVLLLLGGPATAAEPGELSVFGGYGNGDYDSGESADAMFLLFRFAAGDRWQVRCDLPVLRVESNPGVARSALGPVPVDPQHRNRAGGGAGPGNGGSGSVPGAPEAEEDDGGGWTSGLGDVRVELGRRLAGGGVRMYRLDAGLELKAPTAREDGNLGTGEWDWRVGLTGEYRLWSLSLFGSLGWNRLGDPSWVELSDVADGSIGLESEPLRERVVISGWVEGNQEVVQGAGPRAALGLGIRTVGKVQWQGVLTAGLTEAAADFGVMLGLSFGVATPGHPRRVVR